MVFRHLAQQADHHPLSTLSMHFLIGVSELTFRLPARSSEYHNLNLKVSLQSGGVGHLAHDDRMYLHIRPPQVVPSYIEGIYNTVAGASLQYHAGLTDVKCMK